MHLIHSSRNKLQLQLGFRFPAPLLNMKTLIRAANKGSNSPTATRRALKGTISGQRHFELVSPSQAFFPPENMALRYTVFWGEGGLPVSAPHTPISYIFLTKI